MNNPHTLQMDQEKAREMPMVDLAFMILKKANTPYLYRDLMQEIAELRGIKQEEVNDVIAQLYTEINIDGRFACVGTNLWGLKRWYPLDKSEDGIGNTTRPRIINDDDDDDDDLYPDDDIELEVDDADEDADADDEEEDYEADDEEIDEEDEPVDELEDDDLDSDDEEDLDADPIEDELEIIDDEEVEEDDDSFDDDK